MFIPFLLGVEGARDVLSTDIVAIQFKSAYNHKHFIYLFIYIAHRLSGI